MASISTAYINVNYAEEKGTLGPSEGCQLL